ncbi:MAG: hypothetical protein Fur0018_20750 [Anaerolineales bacterium]
MSFKTVLRGFLPLSGALLLLAALLLALPGGAAAAPAGVTRTQPSAPQAVSVFINELHYDNSGTDTGEGAEVAGPAGTDLTGWSLVAYNGSDGASYGTVNLSGVIPDLQNGFGAVFFAFSGLQNGAPDGIALVDNTSTVVQFLSYEGAFTATDGQAVGMTSTDIGVAETGTTASGYSLQLQGSGSVYSDFTWGGPIASTYDAVNTGQTFVGGAPTSDLTIAKSGTQYTTIGGDLIYTITVASQGMTATNVVVTDTLPVSVTFGSASLTYTTPSAGVYVFSLGTILSGTQTSFNITVTTSMSATAGQVFTNTVTVHTDAAGDDPANNSAQFLSTAYPLVSIHDIQYVTDPATNDVSPYSGQTVFVDGIVVAAPGELGSRAMVIEDAAGGPWSGLYVYHSGSFSGLSVARGDKVRVLGNVTEYSGMTELQYTSAEVLSTGNAVPDPAIVPTGDFVSAGTAEPWESVYLEFQNATVMNIINSTSWNFDDGSGATVAYDSSSGLTYAPTLGDYYIFIRGIGWQYNATYELKPRDDNDIFLGSAPSDLGITKSGPAAAVPGDVLVYTLMVDNQRPITVTGVVVTDTLPLTLTFDSASMTYTHPMTGVYVFSLGDLGAGVSTTIQLTATAPMTVSVAETLVNTAVVTTTTPGDNPANNSATASTSLYPLTSIHDIQYVADPAASDASPYNGQTVLVEGVVVAAPGQIDTPSRVMVIADPAGGAWSGLWVYQSSGLPVSIQEGDMVRVLGLVKEYYGLTELDPSGGFVQVLSSGNALPAPAVLSTGQFPDADKAASEQWESVLVEFRNATVTDASLGYGEWYFDDGTGAARADDLGGRDGNLTYQPAVGEVYNYIRGITTYAYSKYKLEPRSDADISVHQNAPSISKAAPGNVIPGGTLAYTITVGNALGIDLTNVVITDSVPAGLSAVTPQDGGVYANGVVTWTLASLPNNVTVSVHFTATAPITPAFTLWNARYAMTAAEWVTPTFGAPVATVVGAYTPIPLIQGDGMTSPFEGQSVKTQGVVVGFFQGNSSVAGNFNGFFIQDPAGDENPATSDAVFVNYGTTTFGGVSVGDLVEVSGQVQEFSEWDGAACYGDECVTQVSTSIANITVLGTGTVTPTVLAPVGDPVSSTLYFESLEGMLVTIPNTATVVGPTSYGTMQVVPGSLGIDRVMRGGPYEGMPVGVRPDERYGSGAPDLIVGSVVSGVDGPLTYSYGDYLIADQDGYSQTGTPVTPPATPPSWTAPTPIQFSAATMNTLNFDAADPAIKTTKLVSQVLQMNAPTFVALEEIDAAGVMNTVLSALSAQGYPYDFAYSHPDVGGHGVALMWRTDMVTNVVTSTAYQGCSAYGSSSSSYDPMWGACQALGQYPLFSRRPVVVTATVNLDSGPQQVVVIANHFKSKLGGTSADQRRLEQGQLIHDLVANFESQTPYVLVMGDLNDFEDSAPLQALYAGDVLTNTWFSLPAEQRYSYVHLGVSQILDHILVSPALLDELVGMSPMHFNADYPYGYTSQAAIWRNSDHDPVVATFQAPYRLFMPLIFNQ